MTASTAADAGPRPSVGHVLQPDRQVPPGRRRAAGLQRRSSPFRGRTSGLPRTTPLAIIDVSGRRWVWAPVGRRPLGAQPARCRPRDRSPCAAGRKRSGDRAGPDASASRSFATSCGPSREACRSVSRSSASSTASISTIRWKRPRAEASSNSTRLDLEAIYSVASPTSQRVGRGSSSGSNCSMPMGPGRPNTAVGVSRKTAYGEGPAVGAFGPAARPSAISSGHVSLVTKTSTTRRSSSAS